jgi:hypothetical protein
MDLPTMTRATVAVVLLAACGGSSPPAAPASDPPPSLAQRLLVHQPPGDGLHRMYGASPAEEALVDATRQFEALAPELLAAASVTPSGAVDAVVHDGHLAPGGELLRLTRDHGSHRVSILFGISEGAAPVPLVAAVVDDAVAGRDEVVAAPHQACIRYFGIEPHDPEAERAAERDPIGEIERRLAAGDVPRPVTSACAPLP